MVAAAVLVVALIVTGRLLEIGGEDPRQPASPVQTTASFQAPERAGGTVQCPPGWPVLVASNHTSYPAGHPGRPPATASAVGCYRTVAQAAAAGYGPALLPRGVLEVGGVYLPPTSPGFRARCQRVADQAGPRS